MATASAHQEHQALSEPPYVIGLVKYLDKLVRRAMASAAQGDHNAAMNDLFLVGFYGRNLFTTRHGSFQTPACKAVFERLCSRLGHVLPAEFQPDSFARQHLLLGALRRWLEILRSQLAADLPVPPTPRELKEFDEIQLRLSPLQRHFSGYLFTMLHALCKIEEGSARSFRKSMESIASASKTLMAALQIVYISSREATVYMASVTNKLLSTPRAFEVNSDRRFDPVQHELDFCIRHLDNYLRIPPSTWTLDQKCAVDVWRVSVFGVFARMAYFMSTFQTDNSVAAFMTSQSRYFTYTGRHAQKLAEVTSTNHMDRVHQTEHSAVSKLSALVGMLQAEMTASHHTDVPFYKLGLLITYLEKSWSYNLDTVRRNNVKQLVGSIEKLLAHVVGKKKDRVLKAQYTPIQVRFLRAIANIAHDGGRFSFVTWETQMHIHPGRDSMELFNISLDNVLATVDSTQIVDRLKAATAALHTSTAFWSLAVSYWIELDADLARLYHCDGVRSDLYNEEMRCDFRPWLSSCLSQVDRCLTARQRQWTSTDSTHVNDWVLSTRHALYEIEASIKTGHFDHIEHIMANYD